MDIASKGQHRINHLMCHVNNTGGDLLVGVLIDVDPFPISSIASAILAVSSHPAVFCLVLKFSPNSVKVAK